VALAPQRADRQRIPSSALASRVQAAAPACARPLRRFPVHAAVRRRAKMASLEGLPGANERLVTFEGCDLNVAGSYDAAMAGCDYVLHTASPFYLNVECAGWGK
jgi:hypothetical protein